MTARSAAALTLETRSTFSATMAASPSSPAQSDMGAEFVIVFRNLRRTHVLARLGVAQLLFWHRRMALAARWISRWNRTVAGLLATEGAVALVRKAFSELQLDCVVATTMTVNTASRRVLEKAGLSLISTFFAEWPSYIASAELGDVEYAVTCEEWRQAFRGQVQ